MTRSPVTKEVLLDILECFHAGVYIVDKDGALVYLNKAAERIDNLKREEALGKYLTDNYRSTIFQEGYISPTIAALQSGKPHVYENLEWYRSDGTAVNAITSTYPIIENGEIIGAFALSENINDLKNFLIRHGAFQRKRSYPLSSKTMKNGTQYVFNDIVGGSEAIKSAVTVARRFASKKMPVMIYGETGTGKEMFAQSIHNASPYVSGPFVAVNCAAIPENLLESTLFGTVKGAFTGAVDSPGLFEQAENGSIFLDEINSMPITLQAKILRALQEKEVQRIGDSRTRKINCRIISATNKQPDEAIKNNHLREDLFYRLSTGMLWLPPLRERPEDLDILLDFFIEKINREISSTITSISPSLHSLFQEYPWPGNIRELANIVESSINMTADGEIVLDVQHLPDYLKQHFKNEIAAMPNAVQVFSVENKKEYNTPTALHFYSDINTMVDQYEKELLNFALLSTNGNLTKCGKKLGISRQSLTVKLKKYGIDHKKYKK
ncbi:MAG: sigma 54-interacting transcriptional regulator [Bacillota bacterium]|nr:sigma 54-interacting transcriptional regulator [Bacillota bacterium]